MNEVREIELRVEQMQELKKQCKNKIALAEALHRLTQNEDFKNVFMHDYVEKESVRLVGLLGDTTLNFGVNKDESRCDIHERMIGISRFREHMRNIESIAQQAENTLESIHQAETENA